MGPIALASPFMAFGGGLILSIGGIVGMNKTSFE
jgi:hypothetical protein